MDLLEHLNENPRLREWYESFSTEADNLDRQGYDLVPGWPADEYNLSWDDYISWCHDQLDEVEEGDDVQPFPTYEAWRDERMPDGDEGFTWMCCELCGGKAGNRYAVSAVRQQPYDYIPYSVCGDCLQYIANGTLPEDM
jgi:hypothetical protein